MADRGGPPWQIKASVGLFAVCLAVSLLSLAATTATQAMESGGGIAGYAVNAFGVALCAVAGVMLYRLWRGGWFVWWLLMRTATPLALIYVVGLVGVKVMMAGYGGGAPFTVRTLLFLLVGVLLLMGGFLLYTGPARVWCGRVGISDRRPGPSTLPNRAYGDRQGG